MKTYLVAPDKLKGSLSAAATARAIVQGIRDASPRAKILVTPLADGGDGTAMILAKALGAKALWTRVHGPLGQWHSATWALHGKTAYMDFASACGLANLSQRQRNPLRTSSRGVGELFLAAVRKGATQIVLGVGGSATVDGGVGAMRALGIDFLDHQGRPIPEGGGGLRMLSRISLERCVLKHSALKCTILADVTNPLLGPMGAARFFGPQKGGTPAMVIRLETGLRQLNRAVMRLGSPSFATKACAGAAGGSVAGFLGVLAHVPGVKMEVVSGIDFVLESLHLEEQLKKADFVITAEGHLDGQTCHGKTIAGVCRLARRWKKPVIAFAGKVSITTAEAKALELLGAFSISPGPCSLEESCLHSAAWLRRSVAGIVRVIES